MTTLVTGATTLVTGAAGFVGLNVVEHLLRDGQAVVALDRIDLPARARRDFAALPGALTVIGGTVLSDADLARALTVQPVGTVIQCAVITAGTMREQQDPQSIIAINVNGAVNTLIAAARRGATRFLYTSSVAVYGRRAEGDAPVTEACATAPVMIYGMTKLACELMLPRLAEVQGIGFAAARLASVFGPWEYATGARDTLSPMLSALDLARARREAVLNSPGRGDFCYSRDIAAGLAALARAPDLHQPVYNLGSGAATTAETWCDALATLCPGFTHRRAREDETPNTVSHVTFDRGPLDISAIRRDAGYAPRYPTEAAARDYLAWAAA